MSPNRSTAATALFAIAALPLSACNRAEPDRSPLPNIVAVVPAASAATPSFSLPTGGAASGATAAAGPSGHGAETSPSTGTGPSNTSAAVGGMAGGQSTGGGGGGKPAPTAGDGAAPTK